MIDSPWVHGRVYSGEHNSGAAAPLISAVHKLNRSSVCFGDLAREHQSDPAPRWLGGVEGDKRIARVEQTGTVVFDRDNEIPFGDIPAHDHKRIHWCGSCCGIARWARRVAWLEGSFDCIAHKIDQHLLELIGINLRLGGRTWNYLDVQSCFQASHALDDRRQ